ncbi:hypothetical protein L9F63_012974, partial [Diploptera punctata]
MKSSACLFKLICLYSVLSWKLVRRIRLISPQVIDLIHGPRGTITKIALRMFKRF